MGWRRGHRWCPWWQTTRRLGGRAGLSARPLGTGWWLGSLGEDVLGGARRGQGRGWLPIYQVGTVFFGIGFELLFDTKRHLDGLVRHRGTRYDIIYWSCHNPFAGRLAVLARLTNTSMHTQTHRHTDTITDKDTDTPIYTTHQLHQPTIFFHVVESESGETDPRLHTTFEGIARPAGRPQQTQNHKRNIHKHRNTNTHRRIGPLSLLLFTMRQYLLAAIGHELGYMMAAKQAVFSFTLSHVIVFVIVPIIET
jgi:hypothetical protein